MATKALLRAFIIFPINFPPQHSFLRIIHATLIFSTGLNIENGSLACGLCQTALPYAPFTEMSAKRERDKTKALSF
jgi:hypothetical protein